MSETSSLIGLNIKAIIRKNKEVGVSPGTIAEFATALRNSKAYAYRLAGGQENLTLEKLDGIAKALNVATIDLLTGPNFQNHTIKDCYRQIGEELFHRDPQDEFT